MCCLSLLVGAHRALRAGDSAALSELGVDGGDKVAVVVVADHRGGPRYVHPYPYPFGGSDRA